MNTYTLTLSDDGDIEIVTADHGRWVAFTLVEALELLGRLGIELHPDHRSIADALGVAR